MALTITGAGGLALLAGMLMLGHIVGSYDLDAVLAAGDRIRAHELYTTMVVLVLPVVVIFVGWPPGRSKASPRRMRRRRLLPP